MPAQTLARNGRKFTAEERAEYKQQKRSEQREAVERATRALLSSDGWRAWAETRATFHDYSMGNCMLIAMQRPDATQVAGFKAWQQLGRQVRKGEHGIRIMAPMVVGGSKDDRQELRQHGDVLQPTSGEKMPDDSARVLFRCVSVFDVAQTDGEPLPEPPREPITGDSHASLIEPLTAHARSLGFSVDSEDLEHAGGYCDAKAQRIVVSSRLASANARARVLVHELAHAYGVSYKDYSRPAAEVIVETAATIVCGALGLDTSGESIPYLAEWGESGDLDAIRKHAETVDQIAGKLEQACGLKVGRS